MVKHNSIIEEKSYSAVLAEVVKRVYLCLAKEANTFLQCFK